MATMKSGTRVKVPVPVVFLIFLAILVGAAAPAIKGGQQ